MHVVFDNRRWRHRSYTTKQREYEVYVCFRPRTNPHSHLLRYKEGLRFVIIMDAGNQKRNCGLREFIRLIKEGTFTRIYTKKHKRRVRIKKISSMIYS